MDAPALPLPTTPDTSLVDPCCPTGFHLLVSSYQQGQSSLGKRQVRPMSFDVLSVLNSAQSAFHTPPLKRFLSPLLDISSAE